MTFMRFALMGFFAIFCVSFVGGFSSARASEDAILVLDASGSMWGQIEGKTKIEIAREVVGELLNDMPTERRLGLVAYGHNHKGDCSDIEEVVPVGTQRAAIGEAVNALNPKGKTPLSAAVKLAAEKLRYTEEKATVILVSDGIETCNLDPCAVGAELEAAGVDFTAHVIGFDVSEIEAKRQLQCLAENTGGRFLSAANAAELSIALGEAVKVEQEVITTGHIELRATELEKGPVIQNGLKWIVQQAGGGEIKFEVAEAGAAEADIPAGVYDIFVERTADGLKGEKTFVEIVPNGNKKVTIALKMDLEATVRTAPESTVSAGADFAVYWTGPERKNDFIAIAAKGASAGRTLSYNYVTKGNPLKLTAPIDEGIYEVRYVLGKPYRVLAKVDFAVTGVEATVSGPVTASTGTSVSVEWAGPNTKGDYIALTKQGAPDKAYLSYDYTSKGSPVNLRLPIEAGAYEYRYIQVGRTNSGSNNNRKVLARQAVTVEAVGATIAGPASAPVNSNIEVTWTGPKESGDFVTITTPDAPEKAYKDYAYTKKGSPSEIRTPLEPGEYELRFVQHGNKVLARAPITVTPVSATISGPASVKVAQEFTVEWTGPKASGDFVTIVEVGAKAKAYGDYAYTKKGGPSKLDAPVEPGAYELRFVQASKIVLASAPITVEDVTATLDAPSSAKAKSDVAVSWTGPGNKGDWITVVVPSATAKKYGDYAYPRNGNPSTITMPDQSGTYELRYVLSGKRIIARKTIQVTAE